MEQTTVSDDYKRTHAHLNTIVVQTFNTPSGQALLEYLTKQYLEAEVFSKNVQGDKQATHAAYREGENNVIRSLLAIYKQAIK